MTGFLFLDMNLVRLENFKLEFEDELLLLKPFRELYKADKTKDKSKFTDFLTVVYYTFDPRSDYNYISDETERLKEVFESNGIKQTSFSEKEKECIDLYSKLCQTTSSLLLRDTKIAVDKLRKFLLDVDLNMLDDKGKPVYTVNSITSTIKQIPQLTKDLMEAERTVSKEIEEQGKARGGNDRNSLYEEGIKW